MLHKLIIYKPDSDEIGLENEDNQTVLDDVGYNVDLYITNQEVVYN